MKLCQQARRYWRYYSIAYKKVKYQGSCDECSVEIDECEVDHRTPIGTQPRDIKDFGKWLVKLFCPASKLQGLCKTCHSAKTKRERKERNAKRGKDNASRSRRARKKTTK